MEDEKFTNKEKELFERIIDYFIREEEREIASLKLPSGNPQYIPSSEDMLATFNSIKSKIRKTLY